MSDRGAPGKPARPAVASAVLAPWAWCGALLALSRLDPALALLPALGLLRGPLAAVLVLAAALASAGAGVRAWPVGWRARAGRQGALFAAAAATYLLLGLAYTTRLRATGDEPHYLVMAQSLWREGDLDLRDNYGREDWREHTPGPLQPHYAAPRADGRPFPAHGVGLPLLAAPVYALGGRVLVALGIGLLAAGLTVRVAALAARRLPGAAPWAWAVAASPPVLFYAFHVYTEVPSALALAGALELLLGVGGEGRGRAAFRGGLAALLASALPVLHVKMLPAAAALGLLAAWRLRGPALGAFLGVSGASAAAYLAFFLHVFGTASPLAVYGGVPGDASAVPLRNLAGLLLDRSFGLLPHAPAFLLALAGLGTAWRRLGREAWALALVGAAVLAPVLFWRMWWGGQCPPARFLVPLVPLLAVAAAARMDEGRRGLARWAPALLLAGLGLGVFMAADPGDLLLVNRGDRPTRVWTELSGEVDLGRYLPSLVSGAPEERRVAVVWAVAIGVLLLLDRLALRRDRVDRLFTGLGLPLLLLLAVASAIDCWAR